MQQPEITSRAAEQLRRARDRHTLNRTASLYIATLVSGQASLILETERVLLRQGGSIALRGSMHAWCNATRAPAVLVTTVFGLEADVSS